MYLQWILNVFRPLPLFHILLRYSLILKWITLFFLPSSIYTQYPHNLLKIKTEITHLHKYSDPLLSTLLKHLWQRLKPQVFVGMTLQAWHTCIWGVSPILLCRSSHALSGLVFALTCTVNCGTSYRQVCAFPNYVQSIEFTSSCRNISKMINGNRMHRSSISSLIAKGLNTHVNKVFLFFILNTFAKTSKNVFFAFSLWCIVCRLLIICIYLMNLRTRL